MRRKSADGSPRYPTENAADAAVIVRVSSKPSSAASRGGLDAMASREEERGKGGEEKGEVGREGRCQHFADDVSQGRTDAT